MYEAFGVAPLTVIVIVNGAAFCYIAWTAMNAYFEDHNETD